jgi:hypothetical protein
MEIFAVLVADFFGFFGWNWKVNWAFFSGFLVGLQKYKKKKLKKYNMDNVYNSDVLNLWGIRTARLL